MAKIFLEVKRYYQTNISQRIAAVNKFNNFIPKTKAENKQCTPIAPFMSAQLKVTGVPQSFTDGVCNKAK